MSHLKRLSLRTYILIILAIITCASLYATSVFSAKAEQTTVFTLADGAWVKAVSEADIQNGGDKNAIRFQLEVDGAFIEENRVNEIKAVATIYGSDKVWEKTFSDLSFIVSQNSYTHYFDFANFPEKAYSQTITLTVTATGENGFSSSKTIIRSMEFVAASSLLLNDNPDLYKYLGGEQTKVFKDTQENVFPLNADGIINIQDYDGSDFKSVYVDTIKQSSDLLSSVSGNQAVKVDLSMLEMNKKVNILAITTNGNIVSINSLKVTKALEDITLEKAIITKENLSITELNGYDISDIKLETGESVEFSIGNEDITLNGLKAVNCGEHTLNVWLTGKPNKVVFPILLVDKKFEISSWSTFKGYLEAAHTENTWDTEKLVGNKYIYATLTADIDCERINSNFGEIFNDTSCASGILDGQGYTISNLGVSDKTLFNAINNFVVKNVAFKNFTYNANFFYNIESSSNCELINCYFEGSSNGKAVPFVKGSAFSKVENVIIVLNSICDYSSPYTFRSAPEAVSNVFVVGKNIKKEVETSIPVLNRETTIEENCGSYKTIEEFNTAITEGLDVSAFDNFCWDLSSGYPVWTKLG